MFSKFSIGVPCVYNLGCMYLICIAVDLWLAWVFNVRVYFHLYWACLTCGLVGYKYGVL